MGVDGSAWMWHCRPVVILRYEEVDSGDELVALSGHIIVIVDPCVIGVEMKIHKFDVSTTGGKAGGV